MIIGIGSDICDARRIAKVIERIGTTERHWQQPRLAPGNLDR